MRISSHTRALLALLLLAASAQVTPQDYPQWRGPNRDGSASGFKAPKAWPDNLTLRWKVEVGEGYATPIVVGSSVYAFTRRDGDEVMMALDAQSGKIRWQTAYPAPCEVVAAAGKHGLGPKATPLFHNGKLYTLGFCGVVSAFDAASGVVRWTTKGSSTFASPVIVELDGVRQVVSMTGKSVAGVSLADGTLLWEHPWVSSATPSAITPILHTGTVIVSGHNMGIAALKRVNRNGKWSTEVVWETKDVSLFMSTPVLIRDTMFGLSHRSSGQFFALDAKTGKTLWLGPPREAANTAIAYAGDLLFLLNDDAELIVARGSRTGFEPLKRYTVADTATWAQPAISENRVFIKDLSSLTLWTFD